MERKSKQGAHHEVIKSPKKEKKTFNFSYRIFFFFFFFLLVLVLCKHIRVIPDLFVQQVDIYIFSFFFFFWSGGGGWMSVVVGGQTRGIYNKVCHIND